MEENIISKMAARTTLIARLNVLNQMKFIDLLTELGYRENKMWSPDEDEVLSKLCTSANKHTLSILDEIQEWEYNGKPK